MKKSFINSGPGPSGIWVYGRIPFMHVLEGVNRCCPFPLTQTQ